MGVKTIIGTSDKKGLLNFNWLKEIYQYKDLFYTLAWREFRIRYAQTFLGFLWAFLQPVATLFIFFFVFGKAIKVDTGSIPYPVFAMVGMTAWTYFSFVVSNAGKSLVSESSMIKKIYFPRLIIPLSKAFVGLIDFGVSFIIAFILMLYFGVSVSANIIWLPFFLLMIILFGLGAGIWISALSVRYRDFQHVVPFLVQIGLYATPVAYSGSLIPEKYHLLYFMTNPLAGMVEGFRWCVLGTGSLQYTLLFSSLVIFLIFISSLIYFRKVEKVMADIL